LARTLAHGRQFSGRALSFRAAPRGYAEQTVRPLEESSWRAVRPEWMLPKRCQEVAERYLKRRSAAGKEGLSRTSFFRQRSREKQRRPASYLSYLSDISVGFDSRRLHLNFPNSDSHPSPLQTYARHGGLRQAPAYAAQSRS